MTQHKVYVAQKEEYKKGLEMIQEIKDYQKKNLAIGLNGDTFQPDNFLQYFTQRNIPFKYYVTNKGVTIGNTEAYQYNIEAIQNYIHQIQAYEEQQCHQCIEQLYKYEQNKWAIGLNGDNLQPDNFNIFYAERQLTFHPYVRTNDGFQIGNKPTYKQNIEILTKYLAEMGIKVKTMTTAH